MIGQKKTGATQYFRLILVLAAIALFFFEIPDELNAQSEPNPISGTPKLYQQKLKLYQESSTAAKIRPEITRNSISASYEKDQLANFWAFDFNYNASDPNGYYQTIATCRDSSRLSTGYYLNIYVENGQNILTSTIASIQNEFINTILPIETNYFGSPPLAILPS